LLAKPEYPRWSDQGMEQVLGWRRIHDWRSECCFCGLPP
jgi:hypothetical protein